MVIFIMAKTVVDAFQNLHRQILETMPRVGHILTNMLHIMSDH